MGGGVRAQQSEESMVWFGQNLGRCAPHLLQPHSNTRWNEKKKVIIKTLSIWSSCEKQGYFDHSE